MSPSIAHRCRTLLGLVAGTLVVAACAAADDGAAGPADPPPTVGGPTTTTAPTTTTTAVAKPPPEPVRLGPAPSPTGPTDGVAAWVDAHVVRWAGPDVDGGHGALADATSTWAVADALAASRPGREHAATLALTHAGVEPDAESVGRWADRLDEVGDDAWTHDRMVADLLAAGGPAPDHRWLHHAATLLLGPGAADWTPAERAARVELVAEVGRDETALALVRSPEVRRWTVATVLDAVDEGAVDGTVLDEPTLDLAVSLLEEVEGDLPRFLARWDVLAGPRVARDRTSVSVVGDSLAWQLVDQLPSGLTITEVDGTWIIPCAVVDLPIVVAEGRRFPRADTCPEWPDRWVAHLAAAEPDAVVVTQGPSVLFDLDVDGRRVAHGSDEWWAIQVAAIESAVAVVREARPHAPVLWSDVPCYRWSAGDTAGEELDPQRLATANRVLAETLARHPGFDVLPYAEHVCTGPDGTEPIGDLRPDGAHLVAEAGAEWWRRVDALVQAG